MDEKPFGVGEQPLYPTSPPYEPEEENHEDDDGQEQETATSPPNTPDPSEPRSPSGSPHGPISPTSDAPQSPDNDDYQANDHEEVHEEPTSPINDLNESAAQEVEAEENHTEENGEGNPKSPDNKSDSPLSPPASPASNQEEELEISPKKRRRILNSDDESDGVSETNENKDDEKKDSDTESPVKKRRAIFGSDDEDSDDDDMARKKKDTDDEGPSSPKSDEGETAKDLVENIFGGSDDEKDEEKDVVDDDDEGPKRGGRNEEGFEWDFDVMMRARKAEKKKTRKRKNDGFDLINDDDGYVARVVEAMKQAAKEDRHSNLERKPALKKRKMLPQVKDMLLRIDLMEAMLDGGMMSAVSEWLAPLPDKSLPSLEIRTSILKLLQSYKLEQGTLRQSGLGKAVMILFKHPKESQENKHLAQKLIGEWARPIFNLATDFGALTRDERIQRDYEQMPEHIKKRRESHEGASTSQDAEGHQLQPGEKGYIGRARVPKVSKTDYVIRPRSLVEGEFKGSGKREMSRVDRATRDFKERTKKTKVKRAVGVSIEGRRMEI